MPAVLVWLLAWGLFVVLRWGGTGLGWAAAAATAAGVGLAWRAPTRWRRLLMALGFPLSWAALAGQAGVPAWAWLLSAAVFLLLYPPSAWRDAPLFPTPRAAFDGLRDTLPLPPAAWVLDAGCGAGDALLALERAYPDARLHGVERSWPLRLWAAWRCRGARVRQGDMWATDWQPYALVYLFQRPESMPRAAAKARQELTEGAWLASLEFPVPDWAPTHIWACPDGRPLWLYRMPAVSAA